MAAVVVVSACATPYQSGTFSLTGGFKEKQGVGHLEYVTFAGNGFISAKTVQQYTLYRCAERAKEKNKSHFLIYESLIHAGRYRPADAPVVGVVGNKPAGFAFVLYLDEAHPGSKETEKVLRDLDEVVHPKIQQPNS